MEDGKRKEMKRRRSLGDGIGEKGEGRCKKEVSNIDHQPPSSVGNSACALGEIHRCRWREREGGREGRAEMESGYYCRK